MDENSTWRITDHFTDGIYTDTQITGMVMAVPEPSAFIYGGLVASIVGGGAWARRRFTGC